MASRTQIRLSQVTGSFGTGAINDQIAAAATGSIATTDLQGVLSHLAGAIKRIHGGDSFSQNTAGEFEVTLQPATADGAALGSASNEWSDLYLADGAVINLGNDQDVTLTHVADTGILLNGSSQIQLRDSAIHISSDADGYMNVQADTGVNININGTDELAVTATASTFGGNIVIPDGGNIGAASDTDAITIASSGDVTFSQDVIITGDLTVNGTQTVLDTTSLVIEDSVIALSSGSAANADVNAAVIFQRATANLGADSDKTNGALMFLQGTGFKLGYTSDTAETAQGSLAIADDDLGELYVSQLSIAGASDNIAISGGALAATTAGDFKVDAATDIILDADGADIFFDDGGTRFGGISMNAGGNTLILSSSAGNSITLSSQTSRILLMDSTFSGLTLDIATANQLQFLDRDDRLRLNFESAGGNDQVLVSGSFKLDNGADPAQLVFKEASPNGTNTLTLDVPAAIGSSYTLTLPASNGTSGQVLKLADGNGNLEFGSAVGDLARSAYKVTAQITPADLDFSSSGNVSLLSAAGYTALNITKTAADLPKALEVFVNGQLLVSGSDGGADTDYTYKGATSLKFAFNLEADDIVQIIQR